MIREGFIVLVETQTTEGVADKIRPVVLVRRVPGPYNDCLVAMVSTQMRQSIEGFDTVLSQRDDDFPRTGLKASSVVRAGRIAVVNSHQLLGRIGDLSAARIQQLQHSISCWIGGTR